MCLRLGFLATVALINIMERLGKSGNERKVSLKFMVDQSDFFYCLVGNNSQLPIGPRGNPRCKLTLCSALLLDLRPLPVFLLFPLKCFSTTMRTPVGYTVNQWWIQSVTNGLDREYLVAFKYWHSGLPTVPPHYIEGRQTESLYLSFTRWMCEISALHFKIILQYRRKKNLPKASKQVPTIY